MTDPVPPINQEQIQITPQVTRFQNLKEFVKTKKLIIGIIGIVVIILIVVISLWAISGGSNNLNLPGVNKNAIDGSRSGSLEQAEYKKKVNVAAQEILFVDALKRSDGFYDYVYDYDAQCVEENGVKTCPFGGVDMFETSNAWAALANFAAYELSGDQKYLDQSLADLQKLNEYCAVDRSQCLWVLVQPSLIYSKTQNPTILAFLRAQTPALKTTPLSKDDFMLAAIQVRSMFMLGDILDDTALVTLAQSKLEELSVRFKQEHNLYNQDPATRDTYDKKYFAENSCWVALANLYSPTVNYSNIKAFLDNGDIAQNFEYFDSPIDIQPCIEAYFILAEKSDDDAAYKMGANLQAIANDAFFDGKGSDKKVYGKGGYLINKPGSDIQTPGVMVLTDAAYASYLQNLELK